MAEARYRVVWRWIGSDTIHENRPTAETTNEAVRKAVNLGMKYKRVAGAMLESPSGKRGSGEGVWKLVEDGPGRSQTVLGRVNVTLCERS